MLFSGNKSRPMYGVLAPDANAKHHLIAAQGEGALAVDALVAQATGDFLSHATILFAAPGADHARRLESLGATACHLFPAVVPLLARLDSLLAGATMGTRLYVSGTEGFIGQVVQLVGTHGIDHHSVINEHRGSLARRVRCVHCKGFTEEVTTNVVPCAHCGVTLLVRDHYSRRLGAFMGVAADAEAPGELPPVQEVYP